MLKVKRFHVELIVVILGAYIGEIEREEIEHKWLKVLITSDSEKEKDEEATFIFVNVKHISESTILTSY